MANEPNTQEPKKRQQGTRRGASAQTSPTAEATKSAVVAALSDPEFAVSAGVVVAEAARGMATVADPAEPSLGRDRLLTRDGELFVGARAHQIAAALELDPDTEEFTRSEVLRLIEQYKGATVQGSHLDDHPADTAGQEA